MKISNKISLNFIIVFTILLIITGGIVYYFTIAIFRGEIFNNLYYSGRNLTSHVKTYIEDQKKNGEILAGASIYRDFLNESISTGTESKVIKNKIDDRLERTLSTDSNITEVFIINKNGKVIASTDKQQVGKDRTSDPYFINGQKEVYLKDVYLSSITNKINFTISVPIKNEVTNNLLGISVIRYKLDTLNAIFKDFGESYKTKEAFLINKDFYFLTPSLFKGDSVILNEKVNTENSTRCFDPKEVDYVTKNGYSGLEKTIGVSQLIESKDYRGIDVIATHNYIPETDWCLITKIDRSEFLKEPNLIASIFIYVFLASLLILIIVSYLFSQKITKPIKNLSIGAKIIGDGNLDYKIKNDSKDEIGQLSQEFNKMTDSIKQSRLEIDFKVKEQTKEIVSKAKEIESKQKTLLNILKDVEKSKNDLEKFKMAVDNASDHIIITDPEGIILFANQAAQDITGFNKKDMIGKKVGDKHLWGGKMPVSFYQELWKTIKFDKKVFIGEINNHRKNGEKYIAMANISPVLDSKNNVVYFVGIERDITHEKEIDRMKTEFISLASHQLRTPLSAIRWFGEMLLEGDAGVLTKDQKEYITNISLSNSRMIDLVNSLLNISRIESGQIIINPKPTDLGALVKDVLSEIRNETKIKKQKIIIDIDTSLPKIDIDPKLIYEVYKNLLTNANKYTKVGGKISISLLKKDKEIISQISDNGFGIPNKDKVHIFERFFRADNISKLETEGTGLGLYLAKAIIESSAGKIWFKSRENVGTTFSFTLPLIGVKANKKGATLSS